MKRELQPVYKLRGVIRHYDWGGCDFLSELLGLANKEREPMAEYWLGAHEMASSQLISVEGRELPLNEMVAVQPERMLGKTVSKKFKHFPYLLKLLDVREMLSIQVHPSKYEAETEWARENAENIPLNAPHRNYKDDNHKPELMVALSDFWLLHGFKPSEQLLPLLNSIPEFKPLAQIFSSTGYDQLYKTVMEMPQESVNNLLWPLLDRIIPLYKAGNLNKQQEDFWAAKAAITFNTDERIDRGIFSIYFLNLLQLKEGQGIFQDAGVLHAYLEGQNVEIMASSDNVLRGGLTTKHIDVKELMKHVKFEETVPEILDPLRINEKETFYQTAAPDFKLSRIDVPANGSVTIQPQTGEIIFLLEGKTAVSSGDTTIQLEKGEAAFLVSHHEVSVKAISDSVLFRASVPVHSSE